jgi:phosphotransferase system HPr (HPr) family protein
MKMIREIVIKNPTGLHARPAVRFIELCKTFQSRVELQSGNRKCVANSIFSLMKCNIRIGETVTITIEGPDEQEAMTKVLGFMNSLEE